jgi:ATP-dependent Lhr-like helicase
LALALQERGIGRSEWLDWVGAVPAFRDMDRRQIEQIVSWMLDRQILWDEAGVLWLGREGQDTYGRKNFLELISVFTAPPLFTVLHGRHELGFVDESTFLARREDGPPVLLLAGRAWRVTHLDWKRRRAHVEPAEDSGRSRWRGEGQHLGSELCRAIRRLLAAEESAPNWSRRAVGKMQEVRGEYSWLDGREANTLVSTRGELTWWTFGGGRANSALAGELARRLGIQVSGSNFGIKFGTPPDPPSVEREVLRLVEADAVRIIPTVSEQALDGLKFSECLPDDLATRVAQARLSDVRGLTQVLARSTRFVRES